MGVGRKSESSCQTQLTVPPFVTKKKIRDSKSYVKNLHYPRIPSGKDVTILQTDSEPPEACPKSEDTIENVVMYEERSSTGSLCMEAEEKKSIPASGGETPKRLSYKSFFQQNKFSRNRLHLKDGFDEGITKDETSTFLKDNLKMASEVSNFLKYLRRKGTDFLTMFDLDNLNGLIDDISNMKHCAEPVSYEDSAATLLRTADESSEDTNTNTEDRKSSSGGGCRRSVSTGMEKTPGEVSFDSSVKHQSFHSGATVKKTPGANCEVSFDSVKNQSFHSAVTKSPGSNCEVSFDSSAKHQSFHSCATVQKTPPSNCGVSFDSVKNQSFHSAMVQTPFSKLFAQEVDDKCLPRGKALNCVTVTRDRHVRVFIKGKSTCTTIDLCPEYLSSQVPKPDSEASEEELVTDVSLIEGDLSSSAAAAKPPPIINVTPVVEEPEVQHHHEKRRHRCEISAEFQVESLQQRLLFLEVCKKLNKAKVNRSEEDGGSSSCCSETDKVVSEYSDTQNANILDISAKGWKTTVDPRDGGGGVVVFGATLDKDDAEEASVTTIDVKEQAQKVMVAHATARGKLKGASSLSKDKVPPRIVRSDFYLGHELYFASLKRNAGGLTCPDQVAKTDESKCHVVESSGLADRFPLFLTSSDDDDGGEEKSDTTAQPDQEAKLAPDLKEVSAEKISLRNKTSYLDVTDLEYSTSLGDQEDDVVVPTTKEADPPRAKSKRKKILLEIVGGKKKAPSEVTASDDDDPSGPKLTASKSAQLVVGDNVRRLLDRVAKSSVELEKFDFTFANFNEIFVGRNLATPSCSDMDVKWTAGAAREPSGSLEKAEDSAAPPVVECGSRSTELDSGGSSENRAKDLSRPPSRYRKKYMKKVLFASEEKRDSDKAEDSSNLESSQSNISSTFGAGSDSPDTKVRFLDEDLVCSKIYPRPRCEEERSNHEDFLTKVEEISRNMSEDFVSIRGNVPGAELPAASTNAAVTTQRLASSSVLTADLERLKTLCEDAIQRNSCDEELPEEGDENEMAQEFYELPSLSVGNASGSLEHSYCGQSYSMEETMTTPVVEQQQQPKAMPMAKGGTSSRSRAIISCRATFHADDCSYANAKRVESLVQKLCQKLSCDHPHTFNNAESFVTHFEKVGKRLYLTPIDKLKSDLKLVLGRGGGSREAKPQLRREEAFRQGRAKQEPKIQTVDRNAKMREKIAKIKRKCSKS